MRGSWRRNRTATYWPPLLWPSAFLSTSPGLLNRGPGAHPLWVLVFSTASYLQLVWSPTDWISCALSNIIVKRPPSSCGRHNFALIQPVHGQGYTILIFLDRMHLLFTQVHFLFWQPGRVVGQYTTVFHKWELYNEVFSSYLGRDDQKYVKSIIQTNCVLRHYREIPIGMFVCS